MQTLLLSFALAAPPPQGPPVRDFGPAPLAIPTAATYRTVCGPNGCYTVQTPASNAPPAGTVVVNPTAAQAGIVWQQMEAPTSAPVRRGPIRNILRGLFGLD